jgi:hypothetical protein
VSGPSGRAFDPVRFARAAAYAAEAHGDQTRKGTDVPYVSHVLAVGALVLEHGGTTDQAIAGLLHDVVEDCGGEARARDVAAVFGSDVAELVLALSDATPEDPASKPPWRPRKLAYHAHLRDLVAAGSPAVLVSACDKLHNLRTIAEDLADDAVGLAVLDRFNAPDRVGTLWNYVTLVDLYREAAATGLIGPRLIRALDEALAPLVAAVGGTVARPAGGMVGEPVPGVRGA